MSGDLLEKTFFFPHYQMHQEADKEEKTDFSLRALFQQIRLNHLEVLDKLNALPTMDILEKHLANLFGLQNINFSAQSKVERRIGRPNDDSNITSHERMPVKIQPPSQSPLISSPFLPHSQEEEIVESSQIIQILDPKESMQETETYKTSQFVKDVIQCQIPDANQLFNTPHLLLQHFASTFEAMSLQFSHCEKIYQYPAMQLINFHQKIDNQEDILFLAELQNNQIVGAFTHLCFDPKPNYIPKENPKAFLCNLQRKVIAFASRVNKTHSHDENYLIFGNWQIKVKSGTDELYTNWGTNGDCFQLTKYSGKEKLSLNISEFFGKGAEAKCLKMRKYNIYAFT